MPDPKDKEIFSFEDDSGQIFISDSLEAIPEQYRKLSKKITVEEAKKSINSLEKKVEAAKTKSLKEVKDVPLLKDVDLPSYFMGFATALAFALVFAIVRRTGRLLFKVGMVVLLVVLVSGAYFAFLRKAAGLGDTRLTSPKVMIDDAKNAAKAMEKRLEEQKRTLEKIERDARR